MVYRKKIVTSATSGGVPTRSSAPPHTPTPPQNYSKKQQSLKLPLRFSELLTLIEYKYIRKVVHVWTKCTPNSVHVWTIYIVKLPIRICIVYYSILKHKRIYMDDITTIKVRKSTTTLLKAIAKQRGRRESMEQVILELVERYVKGETSGR